MKLQNTTKKRQTITSMLLRTTVRPPNTTNREITKKPSRNRSLKKTSPF